MLSSLSTEDLIPSDHPIRRIRVVVDEVLAGMDGEFEAIPEFASVDAAHGAGDAEDECDECPKADSEVEVGDVAELEE